MNFLQAHGINTRHSASIFKAYGEEALDIIRRDPYRMANDIHGIGFAAADRIARDLGIVQNIFDRANACILNILREALDDGHVYVDKSVLVDQMAADFEIDAKTAEDSLEDLARDGEIVMESFADASADPAIYLKPLWQAENAIAKRIEALNAIAVPPLPRKMEEMMAQVENRLILSLSPEQQTILSAAARHRISIITGGPGTGKTTLIRSITEMNLRLGRTVCLAAPTGRAVRRLAEVTGHKAHTLHKLLEYNFEAQTFGKGPNDPIDADILIVDETSMVDTVLMYHFISAVPFKASVILVGDAHQLPPVGPGNVLADLIASGSVPVFYLTTIFRQAAESMIVVNAHHVRNGEFPRLHAFKDPVDIGAEFYFIEARTPEQAVSIIVDLCAETLPARFGLDPVSDIQVLSPMHKGVAGTIHLNRLLQTALNPSAGVLTHGSQKFKIGDKVMHLKNNYPKEVFNGDIGIISGLDKADGILRVDFYGREVEYTLEEMEELALGYTISVHKSQGSEYPAVVMPLLTQHYIMLQRNLLYTAITRAQKYVVLIGTKKALSIALKNNTPLQRCSGLAQRLRPVSPIRNPAS